MRQSVDAGRITTLGAGKGSPVASNDTAAGRQQNRRVEVIISNPALASSQQALEGPHGTGRSSTALQE